MNSYQHCDFFTENFVAAYCSGEANTHIAVRNTAGYSNQYSALLDDHNPSNPYYSMLILNKVEYPGHQEGGAPL